MAMPAFEATPVAQTARPAPVAPKDRIFQLDMLRGWAVLGILAVNAMLFAWPAASQMTMVDPFGHTGADAWGDWATEVFFQDKFRTLFTMLFGVSIFLVGGERDDEDRGRLLRRRLFWLGLFGLVHGAAIWFGDILLHYAYCGFIMLLFRSWSAGRLLWVGGLISALWMLLATTSPLMLSAMGPEISAKMAAGMPQMTVEQLRAAAEAYKAGGLAPWIQNFTSWITLFWAAVFLVPVTIPLMMVGLGLFKSGFLVGRSPAALYGLFVAIAASILAFDAWASLPQAGVPDAMGGLDDAAGGSAPLVTLGYVSLLLLMSRFGLRIVTDRFVPVGRMAFTNYLGQSVIMASLFYLPWGPQWIGTMGPAAVWPVVLGVWAFQLVASPLWLTVFSMGPLEWLWRCLTYGRWVPMKA